MFGPEGAKEVRIEQTGVSPRAMEVPADWWYSFSGGSLTLAAHRSAGQSLSKTRLISAPASP
ncbi:MAG: hypothetical protein LBP22_13150 [Deltaproteobacteria bacterium]|nr:hypothetical protein [Deltaproteobacteria bacterium]